MSTMIEKKEKESQLCVTNYDPSAVVGLMNIEYTVFLHQFY